MKILIFCLVWALTIGCGQLIKQSDEEIHATESSEYIELPRNEDLVAATSLSLKTDPDVAVVWSFASELGNGTWDLYRAPKSGDISDAILISKDISTSQVELVLGKDMFADGPKFLFAELKVGDSSTLFYILDEVN